MSNPPQGWTSATLRDAALPGPEGFVDGDWIEAPYITDAGIRLIQTGNLGVGKFIDKSETRKYISAASYRILKCTPVNSGDVLICRLADPIGRACEVPDSVGDAVTSVDCTITRVDQEKYDKSFLLHWLNSEQNLKAAADRAAGSTRSRISRSNLGRLPLPRPPRGEQSAIGRVLDTLDTTIRQTEAIIEKLKQVKQGLLHDLLTRGIDANGELRPPQSEAPHLYKESVLGWIPTEWHVQRLADYMSAEIAYGIVQAGPHIEGGVPYIRTGDMSGDQLIKSRLLCTSRRIADSYRRSEIRTGDLVMAIRATVGKVLPVPDELDGANLTQGTARLAPNDQTDSEFILWAIRHQRAQDSIQAEIKGTTFAEITLAALREVPLASPVSLEEQRRIAERLSACEECIRREGLQRQKFQALKSGLMDDLLTGRVRVTSLLSVDTP